MATKKKKKTKQTSSETGSPPSEETRAPDAPDEPTAETKSPAEEEGPPPSFLDPRPPPAEKPPRRVIRDEPPDLNLSKKYKPAGIVGLSDDEPEPEIVRAPSDMPRREREREQKRLAERPAYRAPPQPTSTGTKVAVGRALLGAIGATFFFFSQTTARDTLERLRVRVIEEYPHDPEAFTQGLELHGNVLYESTGLEGRSTIRHVDLRTGEVRRKTDLPDDVFGEGATVVGDRIIQLSWRDGRAFVFNRETLALERELEYRGEGWGICYDGTRIVMSNGSDRIAFRDPQTFEKIGEVRVRKLGRPQRHINELECVGGDIYANIWQRDEIIRIDAETGNVTAIIDASGLLSRDEAREVDVLNGIAVHENGHFLLTGKLWPKLFEVEFVPDDAG